MDAPSRTTRPSSSAPVGRTYGEGPSRGEAVGRTTPAPTTARTPSSGRSEPIPGSGPTGGVIDFGSGRVPRPTPAPRSATGDVGAPRPGGLRPGDGRSGSVVSRDRTTPSETARAREQLAQRSARSRARTVTRADILDRYRGSNGQTGAARGSTRGANANDARISAARQDRSQSAAAGRIAAARANKQASNTARAQTVRDARHSSRVQAARKDYLGALSKRTRGARGAISGRSAIGPGSGLYNGGFNGGYYNNNAFNSFNYCFGGNYWNFWGGNPCSWFWGPSFFCSTYWWHCYWFNGGTWGNNFRPSYYYYGPFLPYSSSIIYTGYQGAYADTQVVYVESEPEVVYVDEGEAVNSGAVANIPGRPEGPTLDGLGRAADYYLAIGDRAFREARYGDAVHYYAKAVEYSPTEGILFLILADALFATGDYHYAAYSLRRALQLDPELAANVVDKHSFYTEPAAFDRQLAVLERYLEDHFTDPDARLVLAANYLFGARPAACVDLLESPYSKDVTESDAGQILLNAARAVQFGAKADAAPAPVAVPLPAPGAPSTKSEPADDDQ